MFIPLNDDNPLRSISFPFVTVALILANVGIFVFYQSGLFCQYGAGHHGRSGDCSLSIARAHGLRRQ